jgi:CheY-like chemotaxis protein
MKKNIEILIIDDDSQILEVLTMLLEHEGHKVVAASSATKGLEIALEMMPDVIFLDIEMPKMNGEEVLKKLKADDKTRDIPVIVLSNGKEYLDIAEKLGASVFLYKLEISIEKIRDALASL